MNDKITSISNGAVQPDQPCDSVCIQTDQIYDSCKEKDCLENLNVLFCRADRELIDRATDAKCRKAEILWVYSDVEPVPFNRGFYTVDIRYYFRITLDVFTGVTDYVTVYGLAVFDKKVILFGSEGNAKIFSSKYTPGEADRPLASKTNLPKAVVEAVDPIALSAGIVENCSCGCEEVASIPAFICGCFGDELVSSAGGRGIRVSLGLFTIVRLERATQLLIPSYDFCIPQKECVSASDDSPCELFDRIRFPFDEFYPPQKEDFDGSEGCEYRANL